MKRLSMSLAFACVGAQVAAQDLGGQFARAHAVFGGTMDSVETAPAQVRALIPTLAGRWFRIDALVGDSPIDESMEIDAERACGLIVFDLRPHGPHGFSMTQHSPARPDRPGLEVIHAYRGLLSFQRYVDETAMLEIMGFGEEREPPIGFYSSNRFYDTVTLYHPSPDILVLAGESGLAEYYARCP